VIPRPYPGEGGEDFLLMDWEPSQGVGEFAASASASERDEACAHLARFHLRVLRDCGMVHADPNPGNFGFRRSASGVEMVVYDYGSMIPIGPALAAGFPALLEAVERDLDPLPVLHGMGFLPEPLEPLADRLRGLSRILLEPFLAPGGYDLKDWNRKERVASLLGAERWNFMLAAPPTLLFLMRAFKGLFHYVELLGGRAPFGPIRREIFFAKSAIPSGSTPDSLRRGKAIPDAIITRLRIEVVQDGERKISLTMPGDAAGRLEDLVDPELAKRIQEYGVSLVTISRRAEEDGFRPASLFDAETEGGKRVSIWLE
jgi:hypothetical protein